KNYTGASVVIAPGGTTLSSDANGNATFSNLLTNTYGVTLTVPVGYNPTTVTTRSPIGLPPSTTVNFGIMAVPPVSCTGGLNVTDNGNGTYTLNVNSCINVPTPPP